MQGKYTNILREIEGYLRDSRPPERREHSHIPYYTGVAADAEYIAALRAEQLRRLDLAKAKIQLARRAQETYQRREAAAGRGSVSAQLEFCASELRKLVRDAK